jgi:hypothetical protein
MILALLEQDIPGLTARVRSLSARELRSLARAAAQLALRVSPVDDARVDSAWRALEAESPALRLQAAEQLQRLVDSLDDDAAKFQIEFDEIRERDDAAERQPVLAAAYDRAFAQARACEALVAALEPVLDEAVEGALYEANAALDHSPATIRALVDAVADGAPRLRRWRGPARHRALCTRRVRVRDVSGVRPPRQT